MSLTGLKSPIILPPKTVDLKTFFCELYEKLRPTPVAVIHNNWER